MAWCPWRVVIDAPSMQPRRNLSREAARKFTSRRPLPWNFDSVYQTLRPPTRLTAERDRSTVLRPTAAQCQREPAEHHAQVQVVCVLARRRDGRAPAGGERG